MVHSKFAREDPRLNTVTVFQSSVNISSSATAFDELEMGSVVENTTLIEDEENKENTAPQPTTTVSEQTNEPARLMKFHLLRTGKEKNPGCIC